MDLVKILLVDAIMGRGLPTIELAIKYTNLGLAEFCGNQWNEDWRFEKEELLKCSIEYLEEVYNDISKA